MSPTFVEDERGILILGTPGGSRIISMVLLAIVNYVDHRQTNPGVIAASPRFHHQHLPDRVEIEPDSFREGWIEGLRMKGHRVDIVPQRWGNMQLIHFDKVTGRTTTANDPRGESANRH
jgi:gamma-glutamyltranspeptidase/glutathione hydrolase